MLGSPMCNGLEERNGSCEDFQDGRGIDRGQHSIIGVKEGMLSGWIADW